MIPFCDPVILSSDELNLMWIHHGVVTNGSNVTEHRNVI